MSESINPLARAGNAYFHDRPPTKHLTAVRMAVARGEANMAGRGIAFKGRAALMQTRNGRWHKAAGMQEQMSFLSRGQ